MRMFSNDLDRYEGRFFGHDDGNIVCILDVASHDKIVVILGQYLQAVKHEDAQQNNRMNRF